MEKKFKKDQEVWVKCKYQSSNIAGHNVSTPHGNHLFTVHEHEIRTTQPTEPDTELSDILHTGKSAKREFVERVAPMFFQSMQSNHNVISYVETAVDKADVMWDYIQSLNY